MTEYNKGDRIRVVIEGVVEMTARHDHAMSIYLMPDDAKHGSVMLYADEPISIEKIAPTVREGDVWETADGGRYFVRVPFNSGQSVLVSANANINVSESAISFFKNYPDAKLILAGKAVSK